MLSSQITISINYPVFVFDLIKIQTAYAKPISFSGIFYIVFKLHLFYLSVHESRLKRHMLVATPWQRSPVCIN